MEKLEEAEQTAIERATAQFRPQALANTTTRQSSLSALENMHYSQMIRFDNAEEASMLKSLLNIYDLDCGGWWVALGIASSIGLGLSLYVNGCKHVSLLAEVWFHLVVTPKGNIAVTSNETNLVARCRRVYAHAHDYHINSISNNSWVIRAQLEVNTARLKKLVLLAEVSTASRVITAGVLINSLNFTIWSCTTVISSTNYYRCVVEGLQVKQKEDGIFISQNKYVTEILNKFSFSDVKTTSTPMETHKTLLKDADGKDIDEHLYRSMIGSLMYLTSSRPDIMFATCACARYQVNPKNSHLHAVKRIFRYLKGQPKLGLWYPKDSPFDSVAYTDSDYAGASLDRKSTTGPEYIAASNCCGQVLWIQNQLLDYGYNFMQTKIHIDNESTICIVKNPVFHSKTKHIEIRHHFIKDSNEKKLIQMIKIHTYQNVADLLTKAFDVSRFQYMIASIGMLNL
ncbi:hypothetical protein Tco_0213229 [Tanacetum coccineum]